MSSTPIRLQVALARAGVASRRAAASLIGEGRVRLNGEVVRDPARLVRLGQDTLLVDGKELASPEPLRYYALHKPRGVLSSAGDVRGRRTVTDFLPPDAGRCVPVGRLDLDSEGLLLLSNDGPLIDALLHPRNAVPRTYLVEVRGRLSGDDLHRLYAGVPLPDGSVSQAKPARSKRAGRPKKGDDPGTSWVALTLSQGRKREVRRLCEAVGHPVERLIRVRFGPIRLRDQKPGHVRALSVQEVRLLRRAARTEDRSRHV